MVCVQWPVEQTIGVNQTCEHTCNDVCGTTGFWDSVKHNRMIWFGKCSNNPDHDWYGVFSVRLDGCTHKLCVGKGNTPCLMEQALIGCFICGECADLPEWNGQLNKTQHSVHTQMVALKLIRRHSSFAEWQQQSSSGDVTEWRMALMLSSDIWRLLQLPQSPSCSKAGSSHTSFIDILKHWTSTILHKCSRGTAPQSQLVLYYCDKKWLNSQNYNICQHSEVKRWHNFTVVRHFYKERIRITICWTSGMRRAE